MLREKFFLHALQLLFNPFDLLPRRFALRFLQRHCLSAGQPPVGAVHHPGHHLQLADHCGAGARRRFLLPLRFEKQRRIVQNPLAYRGRATAPGAVQLPGFACIAAMLCENGRHPLAGLLALPRHRHQKLHRHLCRDLAFAHLLLHCFRQQFRQRQPPRHPAHAAIEPPRQLLQTVAETLPHLGQQPAHLQRGLVCGKAERAVQQYGRGFAHRPHHRFHRVPPQSFECGDSLVAIDHYVAVRAGLGGHHHDGHLLSAVSQRGQQPPLAL